MFWFIDANGSAAWQGDQGKQAPALILNGSAGNALPGNFRNKGLDIRVTGHDDWCGEWEARRILR